MMVELISLAVGDTADIAPNAIGGAQYLSAMIGVVLPILVALVTKYSDHPGLKAILLLGLSLVSGFVTEWQTDPNFVWQQAAFGALMTFVIGVATLYGLWRPTTVSTKATSVLRHD